MDNPSPLKMPIELDFATILVGLIIIGIICLSALLWILHKRNSKDHSIQETNAPAWPIGWINFGIFLCTIVVSVAIFQILAGELIFHMIDRNNEDPAVDLQINGNTNLDSPQNTSEAEKSELTPWMAVLSVLLLQIPMLATFYGLHKFYPATFAGSLNSKRLKFQQALIQASPLFIRYLPIIWGASFTWLMLLTFLQKLNIINSFPPQELIEIFYEGGSPTAIIILIVFAVVLAPIVEEIIFRGRIYAFLKSQIKPVYAQIISGLFFAAVHNNLMSFLPLMIVGILLARIYERSGSILVPIFFHAYFNGFNLLMLFLTNNSMMTTD